MMTVEELREILRKAPKGARVLFRCYSESIDMGPEHITFFKAADRKLIDRRGTYITWDERYKKPEDPDPEFVDAVMFPGN